MSHYRGSEAEFQMLKGSGKETHCMRENPFQIYLCVCVCVCVRVRMNVCMCTCACMHL